MICVNFLSLSLSLPLCCVSSSLFPYVWFVEILFLSLSLSPCVCLFLSLSFSLSLFLPSPPPPPPPPPPLFFFFFFFFYFTFIFYIFFSSDFEEINLYIRMQWDQYWCLRTCTEVCGKNSPIIIGSFPTDDLQLMYIGNPWVFGTLYIDLFRHFPCLKTTLVGLFCHFPCFKNYSCMFSCGQSFCVISCCCHIYICSGQNGRFHVFVTDRSFLTDCPLYRKDVRHVYLKSICLYVFLWTRFCLSQMYMSQIYKPLLTCFPFHVFAVYKEGMEKFLWHF